MLGSDHPDLALTLNNLAVLYKESGRPAAAEPLYRRAVEIFRRTLGPGHPNTVTCRANHIRLLREIEQSLRR